MKLSKVFAGCLLFSLASLATADNRVDGHFRRDGAFVPDHYRSPPNSSNWDNYSTRPNVNPYTGREGSRPRDYSPEAFNYGRDKQIYEGPRGGQYYLNESGKKIYVPKR